MIPLLALHLLDSTAFALLAMLLTLLLRRAPAAVRHALLLAATLKFALPLRAFFSLGVLLHSLLHLRAVAAPPGVLRFTLQVTATSRPAAPSWAAIALSAVWLGGAAVLLARWFWQSRRAHRLLCLPSPADQRLLRRAAHLLRVRRSATLRLSRSAAVPYLAGVLRPVLVLPSDLRLRLAPAELQAVLLHELAHLRRRDNLALTLAHVLSCIFWFHPLLWWLERRLRAEGEMAADELVLAAGVSPEVYVEGICKTSRLAFTRPVAGRSYLATSPLTSRLERIMSPFPNPRPSLKLRVAGAACLPLLLFAAVAAGALTGVPLSAQPPAVNAKSPSPDGGGVYSIGNGVTAPVLTHSVEPEYTETARKQKIAGNVLVGLVVGTDGTVHDVRLVRSVGEGRPPRNAKAYADLDQQALAAVRQYRFQPGLLHGQPVPVALKIEVNFQIF